MEPPRLLPTEVTLDDHPFDLASHPSLDLLAVALVTGEVQVYGYGVESSLVHTSRHHKEACRAVTFSHDGQYVFTGSSDHSLAVLDVHTGQLLYQEREAHNCAVNVVRPHLDYLLLTGDDEGGVKLWDLRKRAACFSWKESEDFISDMCVHPEKPLAVCTSGDGHLSVLHLRNGRLEAMSDHAEDELLSCALMKGAQKVVVGTQHGELDFWTWGEWGDFNDRLVGHPSSVDCMTPLTEDLLVTGCSDGLIRVCSVLPNRVLAVIGEHEGFDIERVRITHDRRFVASASHDQSIRFWSLARYTEPGYGKQEETETSLTTTNHMMTDADSLDEEADEDDEEEESDEDTHAMDTTARKGRRGPGKFFSGLL